MLCGVCGEPAIHGARFCAECGAELAPPALAIPTRCIRCSAALMPGGLFCPECGAGQETACGPAGPSGAAASIGAPAPSTAVAGRPRWLLPAAAGGAILLLGSVAYAAVSAEEGGAASGRGSRQAAAQILRSAMASTEAATSVDFLLKSRYSISTSDGTVEGGSDLAGESDLVNQRSQATYTPVGLDAELLQSLSGLVDGSTGHVSQGIEVVVADGTVYTRMFGGSWTSDLSDALSTSAGDPTAIAALLSRCAPVAIRQDSDGGATVECTIPTDAATLEALGANLSAADLQALGAADLELSLDFTTSLDGHLESVAVEYGADVPDGSVRMDVLLQLREWNMPVSIDVPGSSTV